MSRPKFSKSLLHPKHLPIWFGMAIWWLLVQLFPYRVQMAMGSLVGLLLLHIGGNREKIARKNIDMCFPEKSATERAYIVKESLKSVGKGFFESGMAWFWPAWRLRRLYTIDGLHHLEDAKQAGYGVLYMGIHFTPIEICAAFINLSYSIDGFYRPHRNPVYEFVQQWGRIRHNDKSQVIPRNDVRGIITRLRNQSVINYAPDQDYGRDHSVFVPFFGIPAATITALPKLKRLGKAKIIPYTSERLENKPGYKITIYPELQAVQGESEVSDAKIINDFIEARVRENPTQYLWVHRRFKTRPDGEYDFYKINKPHRG